ncbi:hypothetical protein AMTRI_Chr05g56960 [Amborella trichopoda]
MKIECKYHVDAQQVAEDNSQAEEIKNWDVAFVRVDQAALFVLVLSPNWKVVSFISGSVVIKSVEPMKTNQSYEICHVVLNHVKKSNTWFRLSPSVWGPVGAAG